MHIFLYNKEAFPRPLNRDGEFAQEPYSITVPNEAYIQELDKLITAFNPKTIKSRSPADATTLTFSGVN